MKTILTLLLRFHQEATVDRSRFADRRVPTVAVWFSLLAAVATATSTFAQPVVTSEPRTQFQWESKRVALSVNATGTAPFAYQWQFQETNLPAATNRLLTFTRVQLSQEGEYRAIISDANGSVTSQVARVMVRSWPQPTGPTVPELAKLDTQMKTLMLAHNVPGGSLAVVKDGRLVLARGYGFADVENNEAYQPNSLCRGASLSKLITAATTMKLVEEGKLDLDAPVLRMLDWEPPQYPGADFDARWTNVTTRQALHHTGGWDRTTAQNPLGYPTFDPSWWPNQIAQDLQLQTMARPIDVVKWMLGKPMQFEPGTATAYSNFGYEVVGTLIEKLSGSMYEELARRLLGLAGITRMRIAGDARSDRRTGEATYYLHPSIPSTWTVGDMEPRPFNFDLPYAWRVTLYPAAGGWLFSAIDYARFVAAIDGNSSYPDILSSNSVAAMVARPKSPVTSGDGYKGLGWDSVSPSSGVWFRGGFDTGNRAAAGKGKRGVILVFTMNTAWEADASIDLWSTFSPVLDGIRQWPTHDLFPATLSYDAWQAKHFSAAELGNPSISGDDADADDDGISNLLEYANGTDPRTLSEEPRLTASIEPDGDQIRWLTIRFRRLLLAHEVTYRLETSEDLQTWLPFTNGTQEESTLNADGTLTFRTRLRTEEAPAIGFLRLRISRKAQ